MNKTKPWLVIHVDDLWMNEGTNQAFWALLSQENTISGSIMAPYRSWVEHLKEIVWNRVQLWVHLCLTYEWGNRSAWPLPMAWKSTLTANDGIFYASIEDVRKNATKKDIERECRSQIEHLLSLWYNLSHIDAHMWVFFNSDLLPIYIRIAREYSLVPLLGPSGNKPHEWFYNCNTEQFQDEFWVFEKIICRYQEGDQEQTLKDVESNYQNVCMLCHLLAPESPLSCEPISRNDALDRCKEFLFLREKIQKMRKSWKLKIF